MKGENIVEKPIYEEYILAHHLQHLSPEARDKIFIADSIQYQEYLQNKKFKDILDFDNVDDEEVLI